jgi:hypothetical protein
MVGCELQVARYRIPVIKIWYSSSITEKLNVDLSEPRNCIKMMESIEPITSGDLVREKLTVFPVEKTRTLRSILDSDDEDGHERLSSRSYLVITAVMLIYFGQLVTLIGAGAVSP